MGPEEQLRYMVIERYRHGRNARPGHRVAVFQTAEEAAVEVRKLRRRSPAAATELLGIDPTGRMTTLWSS